jgi:predicted nucleic acid-binding protein
MTAPCFIDTWGWLALGNRRDTYHDEIKRFYARLQSDDVGIYTSDYVLDELVTILFRRENIQQAQSFIEGIFSGAATGKMIIERITSERFSLAWKLRDKYRDKPLISFTDLTSMVVMEQRRIKRIITRDDHFLQVGMGLVIEP